MRSRARLAWIVAAFALSCSPLRPAPAPAGSEAASFPVRLADALSRACPPTRDDDQQARDACASKLASLPVLRDHMAEPFLWGAQSKTGSYAFENRRTTRLNPLAWRKMYLSLQMFTGEYRVERDGERTILRASTRFRSGLDPGQYPYPFWHSADKWESYQLARETLFVIDGDELVGALRSVDEDRARPTVARAFDGDWKTGADDGSHPVVLYRRLFSPSNPHVEPLERAFRAFEAESRQYNCPSCHRPDNVANQAQLEMLCYPNQALVSRHTVVRAIEERKMPPPSGVADDEARRRLLDLARTFEATAEAALASESAEASGR